MTTAARRNRIDPFGDLHAIHERGLFTGNRGCVVDDHEQVVRHHGSVLWLICRLEYRGWRWPLARPGRWTPLFFLDDAVGLAAGHRPCATCRRADYLAYQSAVTRAIASPRPLLALELNRRLHRERHRPGRGLGRGHDRLLWSASYDALPDGTVVVDATGAPRLVVGDRLLRFDFAGWTDPIERPWNTMATVLTPPTSVLALGHGFVPTLHPFSDHPFSDHSL